MATRCHFSGATSVRKSQRRGALACRRPAVTPFADQIALELREGRQEVHHRPPLRRGRVATPRWPARRSALTRLVPKKALFRFASSCYVSNPAQPLRPGVLWSARKKKSPKGTARTRVSTGPLNAPGVTCLAPCAVCAAASSRGAPHAVAVPPLSSHSAFRFALITLTLFASFERDLIHDRVTAGLERAGKAGKTFGRPAPTTKAGPLSSTRSAFVPWPPQPRASVRSPPSSACTAPPCAA